MGRKIKKHKPKTNLELLQGIRRTAAPPSRRHEDEKKARDKKACRGKVTPED